MFQSSLPIAMMEKSASALWQRAQVIQNNIVNRDTPNYKAKRLDFESLLKKEMQGTTNVSAFQSGDAVSRIHSVEPALYEDRDTRARADGNNVDSDAENIELTRTYIQMSYLTQKMNGHYSTMKYAITGGR